MNLHTNFIRPILIIWSINCVLGISIALKQVWIPYMSAGKDTYSQIQSDPFDGTVYPIAYIPDWTKPANQDKSKRFEDIAISEFLPLPKYDLIVLADDRGISKASMLARYTYTALYMGNYRLDYLENAGGHLGVDIRSPIGTPVLSIANGVVIRTVEADASGNKFIVVRHDRVPLENGTFGSVYSGYLHLSEILVPEGTKIRKGDMIGRVGITGITTTPHLHLQIDTEDAPFHPYWHFSTTESKNAGLSFFDSINAGLNKDLAKKYTLHPLMFIDKHIAGYGKNNGTTVSASNNVTSTVTNTTVASSVEEKPEISCQKKRYSDVSTSSPLGKILYKLIDERCLFQHETKALNPKGSVTRREAIMAIMDFYKIPKSNGISPFLDIQIGDTLQKYAITANARGYIEGNYFVPDQILTKEEFIELVVKVANPEKNPSQMKIYTDVENLNPRLSIIQDYGYMVRARGGKIYPKSILTRQTMIQMLGNLKN